MPTFLLHLRDDGCDQHAEVSFKIRKMFDQYSLMCYSISKENRYNKNDDRIERDK